jgi:hypothetical protein
VTNAFADAIKEINAPPTSINQAFNLWNPDQTLVIPVTMHFVLSASKLKLCWYPSSNAALSVNETKFMMKV